ncbi:MAG: T9SS type A sorting domain-containing protein [FCB group bacterium]|nr:T9SS type A sorting domain-containing protein [FCB group bacterium]
MLYRISLILLIPFLLISSVYGIDRTAIHEQRIGGIPHRAFLAEKPQNTMVLASGDGDIQISESIAPATFKQDQVSIVSLKDNTWLAAWSDNRLGNAKIYWQHLDASGNAIDDNLLVASSTVGADYVDPKLAVDTLGRIFLFYRDRTNGLIFGSRYYNDLTTDMSPFLVNDTNLSSFAGPYDFSVYPDGRIVVVWENYTVVGSAIEMKLFDKGGNAILGPAVVNSDGGSSVHWVPSVAVDPTGNYLIAWEDYRNLRADIYCRLFNGNGLPLGNDFSLVPPPYNGFSQFTPQVAFSTVDKFVIGWIDQREGQEIYMQKYNAASGLVGSNVILSSPDTLYINWDLNFSISPDDKLLATWASFGPQNNIMQLQFDTGFTPLGQPQIATNFTVGRRWAPVTAFNKINQHALGWTEFASNNADINMMIYGSTGLPLLSVPLRLNDDSVGAVSSEPFVIPSAHWYNLVVFQDQRNDAGDIYCQTISNAGIKYLSNVKVNQDSGNNLQTQPSAAVSMAQAKSLIVWVDNRSVDGIPGQRIFGRWGNELGEFTQNEFIISDSFQTAIKNEPKAIMNNAGRGLVVWEDKRDGTQQIYGRWLNPNGTLDGNEFMISNPTKDTLNVDVQLGLDSLNRFYVVWLDKGLSQSAVKIKWFNVDGSEGNSFDWTPSIAGVTIDEMSAAVYGSGNISLLWSGTDNVKKLYLTVLNNDATVVLSPLMIADNNNAQPSAPVLAVSNNNYLVAGWLDRRDINQRVYYQVLDDSYQFLGGNQPVSSTIPEIMLSPTVSAFNGRAWFGWVDSRSDGFNIYATNFVYLPTDVNDDKGNLVPKGFSLNQNYPNPFNPSTEITFSLPAKSNITLAVYNMLGQKVTVLAQGMFQAGEHEVLWNGKNKNGKPVSSGMYFYRLQTDSYSETKKMILLK